MTRNVRFAGTLLIVALFALGRDAPAQVRVSSLNEQLILIQTPRSNLATRGPANVLLTQHGYIVMAVDNCGTATPRGRAWRKIVYGEVGVTAVADQTTAARTIGRMSFVDSTRMASGVGVEVDQPRLAFFSRRPTFTGWEWRSRQFPSFSDTIYQERDMGPPSTNAAGYRRASALPFAKNLKADLLIVHGSGDDNVHYQNTEAVVNALVEANKSFTMMVYPNRTHRLLRRRQHDRAPVHAADALDRGAFNQA